MRFRAAPVVAVAAACQRASGPAPAPAPCEPSVPTTAQHPLATRAAALAGEYQLIQVHTQPVPGMVSSGRLHLARPDSAARAGAVGGAVRELIGWLDPSGHDSASRVKAASRDPARPGAALAGQHLLLGEVGTVDGYVEHLTITAVAPNGFWGWWKAQPAFEVTADAASRRLLPDPAGYFCALRVQP